MMKAFSFLTILESLSKKLSILRTKMHSDDLRVNHGTITSQLRVSRPFSRTSFGASFGLSRRASHFAAILTILFTVGVGNVWGEDYSSLNYNGEENLPTGYTYYGKSAGVEDKGSFSVTTCDGVKVFDVTATGGTGTYNKRCIEFTITEDCSVEIKLHTGNAGRVFRMYNGSEVVVKEVTLTSKGEEYTFSYDFKGATKQNPQIYSFSGSGSKTYISKITFTSSSSGGGEETKHTVSFNTHGGGNVDEITQSSAGAEITLPAAPTRDGYTFNGWFTAATGGTKVGAAGASYTPTGNITLHAQWIGSIATKTYGNITFLDVASIEANRQDLEGKQYLTYGSYYIAKTLNITTWYNSSDENPGSNLETSGKTISNPSNFGFFPVSENNTDINYGGVKVHASRQRFYYVTGATSVAAIVADNGESKYVQVKIQTVNQNGQLGEVNTKGSYNSKNAYLLDGGDLDPTKYYKITFTSNDGSNCYLYQIRFGKTPATFSVTYDANEATSGTVPTDNEDYENGATVTVKSNTGSLAKTGYTFGGWNTKADGTGINYTAGTGTFTISANTTLYAKWNAITYNITFDKENGTGGTTQVTATYNSSTIASITNPTRECYTFEGWYSGDNGTGSLVINTTGVLQANVSGYTGTNGVWIATENKTLYAKWTKNATTLLLQRTGSEATPAGGVAVGGDAGTLNCIAEQGTIASYQWKQNTRGSKDGAVNAVGEGATTANFSPKPTAAGSYWYYCVATDECGNEVETTLSGCFLFKALYTVTFNPNNGSVDPTSATQSESGAAIILPTPTRSGYMFTGWYTAASGGTKIGDAGDSYIPTANITLYAQWETPCVAPTNAVINGGGTYNSGSNITLTVTANNITNGTTTYTWYRSNLGQEAAITAGPIQEASTNNTYVINSCVQSDAQVYYCLVSNGDGCNVVASTSIAINVVTTYTLTYDANAGTDEVANMPAPEQHTPGTYTLSDLVPTRTGYTFAGWNRNPEGTGDNFNAAAQFTTGALNETLYAKWTPETYYINYYEAVGEVNDINGLNQISIVGAPTSYTILDEVTLPALPAKDGYTATGWYSQWCVFENIENTQYWAGCEPTLGHLAGYYGHANYIVKYTLNTPVTPDPGTLTALECNTLYKVADMVPSGITLSETGQYAAGISANGKFEVIGDAAETSNASGTPEMKTGNAVTLDSKSFEAHMWMKGAANLTADIPTSRAIKFILSQKGTLTIYYRDNNNGAGQLKLIEEKSPSTAKWTSQTKGDAFGTSELEAGTYYIYATAGSTAIYGIQLNCVTCTTPAAPTSPTNGVTTSNSQAVSWTDTSNDAWEVYLSTSSSTPGEGQSPTAEPTTASYTFTGLTASTTYYWWVRSVCDASHKSAWVAGSSFTTNTAAATPMVIWNLNVGTSATTTIFSSGDSDDHTNVPVANITVDQTNDGANGAGASNRTTKLALATGESAASVDNPDKYELFTFKVACGKKLTPSEVKIKVANVGSTAGGNQNYKAVLSDAYGHSISNTFTGTNSDGTVEEFSITNGGGTYFQGDVTLKLWSCKGASGNASAFRMGTPVEIYGTIEEGSTPTATITWNTQPADGQVGSADFAYAVSCSDGSAVTVTSADPSIATIVDGKLHYVAAGTTHLVASATDACGNEITQNSNDFTVTAASVDPDPEPGTCVTIFEAKATSKTAFEATTGTITSSNLSEGDELNKDGYKFAVKPNNSNALKIAPKAGETFKVGDKLTFVVYTAKGEKSIGFKIGSTTYTETISKELYYFTHTLEQGDIQTSDGQTTITFNRNSADDRWVAVKIERCAALTPCTTPVLSDLDNKKVCPGSDVTWTANNTAELADGETIAYQWTKNSTVLSNNATLTLNDITEAAGGTYVVTATVSAEGKASATATKEVPLTVTPATATPTITASASTIFAGNPVTLKATCVSSGVTYQWYKCTDAEGTTAQIINDEENATLALTAGDAGTYYYKVIVTGDDTNSCGTAEKVYELVVSSAIDASDCTTYFWFPYAQDATTNGVTNNENKFFGNSPRTGDNNSGTYEFELDDITYTATRNTGASEFTISFTVPENSIGTMAINCKGSSSKPLYLKHTDNTEILVSNSSSIKSFVIENITPGTWTLQSSGSWTLSGMAIKVCSGSSCTDPQVTATVDNATVCEGTKNVTFTATNYADGAEFQWQKKNGNTWENISGATSATYTISSVTTAHAGQYRVIAEKGCKRMSEEIKLTVLTAPTFNTFATTASVMKGNALAISDVQATGATGYAWYKSADNSLDAAEDTKVGTSKDLLLAAASIPEAADQTFYLFCVASNSCGSVTSNAITVTVTPFVEEECATKGNEGDREFGFENKGCGQDTYGDSKTPVWKTSSRSKYLTYTAPEGRYFATAKVTVAHSDKTKCGYAYSTDGGATWKFAELDGLSATLTQKTIDLSELSETVNAFRISRNLQDGNEKDWGVTTGTFYLAEICFTYTTMCTETTLTAGSYNNEYNISTQMDFVEPTFTLKAGETTLEGQTLTYTSSNTAIATVDEDGNVTFEGMTGTVTITATFAGGEISETEYCACQGSYTITVGCKDQAPKIVAAAGTNLNGCNNSITLEAKMQDGTTAFVDGTFQWYRDGEAIDGATSASYIVVRAGTYTVSRTYTCTTMSSNSAVVTNENVEPQVERLTPFQYYHVDKTYSNQMKGRHLFAVTSYGTLNGKRYHLTATRNGETLDLSSSTAFFTIPSSDNAVDTVMIDLNELKGKYSANDEIVITCAPINSCNNASAITASITIHVIDQTPTLALICSGADGEGTRDTKTLVVGGDFLTGYNKADLCQQTGNKTFDPNTEWGFYTELKKKYIVTPVNGYAEFNKLNYEPFDILLLTDYPKASKSEAAATILDDMAALCDYRPLLSLKAHMVAKSPSKWAAKGFTTSPVVPATTSQYANIVCYAHPMFDDLDDAQKEGIYHDHDDYNQLVYKILTGPGHESGKGLQGFELKDADNFVTIGLIHYNAAAAVVEHDNHTHLEWTPAADDRQLVAIAERQANIEARMILFAINCGAQSMQTPMGRQVLLTCLDYLLKTDLIEVADCRLTFDNGEGNTNWDPSDYEGSGEKGDGLWSTAANWGPGYNVVPGRNNDVRIAAPCIVDAVKTKVLKGEEEQIADAYFPEVLSIHITKDGSLTIPANSSLTARSTILRADENGNVYPTNVEDISLGSDEGGNASLILNNERGDTKAGVAMYSTAKADEGYSAAESTWQYIGTPHSDVQNAVTNYYNSWLYQYGTESQSWEVIPNGGPLVPFRGYCITHPELGHTYWMEGTLTATTNQDITIPANKFVVVANSWTAPIQINELTDDDMEGLRENTIYFFNTGSDPDQEGQLNVANGRYAAGTYVSVPIHSAPYTGDSYIPSMQGFYVVGGNADGTLHLDYERHVRAPRTNTPSGPMHAPARRVAADNEPQVAKFLFRGKRYDDRLIILERPDFTRGYDSGWDGEQWGGNAAAPMSYVVTETRWDAVSAIPEYEGTVIAFRAGEDSEYTIHFDYDGMEDALYLLDTDTQIYTRVLKGNSYTFTCTDKAEHNRFILTRKAPQIATGTDHINTDSNAKAVKFIKDDKIFIFVNGMLYDATGKMVIR